MRKNMSGALSLFADSLESVGQSTQSGVPLDFLDEIIAFFPMDKVDKAAGTYDQYLVDLQKTVIDNYEKGNYQVSYFYAHLIFMSYVYYCVERAYQVNPERMKDVFYPINAYNGREDKPDIEGHGSVYDFSKIPEKEIFKVFRVMGMEHQIIRTLAKYISDRDDYAHATGQGNISEDALLQNVRTISKNMESIHSVFLPSAKETYAQYLINNCEMEYDGFCESIYDFVVDNMFSLNDIKYLCNIGISGIRDENEVFKEKYRFIKKAHCAFLEYCIESMDIEEPDNYETLRDTAYLYYKYKNNATDFVENELGLSAYRCGKDGVDFPVYECPNCGEEQLAFDSETRKARCFACETDYEGGELSFCEECGKIMVSNEIGICQSCIERKMEE